MSAILPPPGAKQDHGPRSRRAALDDDLDASTARDAIDVLAGAIIAHAGDDPTAPAGLRQAAGLLGIHLDETPPGDAPSGT